MKVLRYIILLAFIFPQDATAERIMNGTKLQKTQAGLRAFGYSKGSLNMVHIDEIREFVGLPGKENELLERLKIWRIDEGYLLISYVASTEIITNLTYYLREARYSADAVDFRLRVSSFDPSTGQLVVATKAP